MRSKIFAKTYCHMAEVQITVNSTRSSRVCICSKFIYECNSLTLLPKATIQLPVKFRFQPTCNLKIFDLNLRTGFKHVCHKREVQQIRSLFGICSVFNRPSRCSCFLNHWPTCVWFASFWNAILLVRVPVVETCRLRWAAVREAGEGNVFQLQPLLSYQVLRRSIFIDFSNTLFSVGLANFWRLLFLKVSRFIHFYTCVLKACSQLNRTIRLKKRKKENKEDLMHS